MLQGRTKTKQGKKIVCHAPWDLKQGILTFFFLYNFMSMFCDCGRIVWVCIITVMCTFEREREREREVYACVSVCVCVLACVGVGALQTDTDPLIQ